MWDNHIVTEKNSIKLIPSNSKSKRRGCRHNALLVPPIAEKSLPPVNGRCCLQVHFKYGFFKSLTDDNIGYYVTRLNV